MRKKEAPMATQDSPNLYERLGGVYSIATVVDDLIDRVMADERLNANPLVDEAHHKVPPAGFKYLVTEMLCWAAGGPQKYTGKDMKSSHRHLRNRPGEWDAFMDDDVSPCALGDGHDLGPLARRDCELVERLRYVVHERVPLARPVA